MATDIEYALLAGASYISTRPDANKIPLPVGWLEAVELRARNDNSGFEATTFKNGTEIVISYAGTYDKPMNPLTNPDLIADAGLATGFGSKQLELAADYFLRIRAANPKAQITLTGHSLGGGLAALVSVFFGVPAWTFDQAPFAKSAEYGFPPDVAANLKTYLLGRGYTESNLAVLTSFLRQRAVSGGIPNQNFVTNLSVEGEFLSVAPLTMFNRIGTEFLIRNRTDGLSGTDLHAQSLLAAYLQSGKTAEQGKALNDVTYKLTDLLAMIFDKVLFAKDTDKDEANFLEHLVRHEAGNVAGVAANGDAMVTRFTRDLWKLAQDGGLTLRDGNLWNPALSNLSKALTAFAMQKYYDETQASAGYNKTLFSDVQGGIQFDRADVVATLGAAKGDKYVQAYVNTNFIPAERTLINSLLPVLRDWTIQAGTEALNNADTRNRNAFLLGGSGDDGLAGGSGSDLLIGNAGTDLLQGKGGNDTLLGGSGNDTYVYTSGDGLDTLLDVEGQNTLAVDGDILDGGAEYGDARVHRSADGKHLYVRPDASANTLLIDGNLLIQNYATGGSFGLNFTDAIADTDPQTTRDIYGDLTPIDSDPAHQQPDGQVHDWTDGLGNIAVSTAAMAGRADTLYDDTGNERIESGGGNDVIYAMRGGDNWIDAGAGRDMAYGGSDKDVLIGGADGDILYGGAGPDRLYGAGQTDAVGAIAQGQVEAGSGQQGDWLTGAAGDDTLIAGADNDVLSGGGGTDLLIGGGGDDDLLGDTDWLATDLAWRVTEQADERLFTPVDGIEFPADGAADAIYAGAGNDHAWGGIGNDAIFGEAGDDSLAGEDGNDILLGGAGEDILEGDGGNAADTTTGHDYLDGGADDDTLHGNAGDDILIGGKGTDTIYGGQGRDTYYFNKGDGIDTIYDDDSGPDKSILVFGEGFDKNTVKLRKGSLLLDLGDGDAIHIDNFDHANPRLNPSFAAFQFADGSSLSWEELLQRGFDLDGTDFDDEILGTGVDDRISGLAGNDLIWGLDGNDILTGGSGTDGLNGGLGDDSYLLNAGDGLVGRTAEDLPLFETLLDEGGDDTIRFAADVLPSSINLVADTDNYLTVNYGSDDSVVIADGLAGAIEHYTVGAGATARTLSYTQFIGDYGSGLYAGTDAAGHLHLTGGNTDDNLYTAAGSATVSGGRGNDLLRVYGTANTLHYSVGDGTDLVQTSASANAGNVVKLSGPSSSSGQALTADDLSLHLGPNRELELRVGADAADALRFSTFNPDDVDATPAFDHIQFAPSTSSGQSGITLTYDELMARGFDIAGTAEADLLLGTNVDDRINGGLGDDLLIGGAGNDSYRFNAGDGQDVIQDAEGVNTVQFGAGLTAQTLSVAQSRAEDGQRYLDLEFGNGDRLSIMEGELDRMASFAFADAPQEAPLGGGTTWSTRQVLALLPAVNLRGGDGDEVLAGFGGDDLIDGGAGNDVVTGGDGADRLYGGLGNDILQGDAGADVLDGGAGNDTLAGGSGIDTYRFGAGMGQDSVIETGGEASVIELTAGTSMVTTVASREGDDLLLATRLGGDALRIAGYYTDPDAATHWTVKTADGVVRNMGAFLQGMGSQASTGSQFIAGFRERWVSGWNAWHVNQGYGIGADGVARLSQSSLNTFGTLTRLYSETKTVTVTVENFETGDGEDTYGAYYGFPEAYRYEHSFNWPQLLADTYQSSSTTMSPPIRLANFSFRSALPQRDQPAGEVPTEPYFIPAQSGPSVSSFRLPEGATTMLVKNPDGSLKGTWVYPGGSPVPPQPEEQTITVQKDVLDISTTYTTPISFLGAGDDAVAGLNLDGGSGNDLLAIDSDDRWHFRGMNLPVFLYGNDGNDWLTVAGESAESELDGEAILIGGRGRDRLIGTAGRDVYWLLEEDSIDTLVDRSGNPAFIDEVVFAPGVTAESLRVTGRGGDLTLLTAAGTGATIHVATDDDLERAGIEAVSFADGSRLSAAQLLARLDDSQTVMGSTWNDTLLLGAGDDTIDGGQGNDVLAGGGGNDTYRFGRGGGQDVIDQADAAAGDVDVLRFADDVRPADVAVFRDGHNLYLEIADSGDLMVVAGWYATGARLAAIEFGDGTVWPGSQFDLAVPFKSIGDAQYVAPDSVGTAGDDELRGFGHSVRLIGGAGDDTLVAGSGVKVLRGGAGNDSYAFGRGDGARWLFRNGWGGYFEDDPANTLRDATTVIDQSDAAPGDFDVVRMKHGVAAGDVAVDRVGDDLVVIIADTDDRLVLQDWFAQTASRVRGVLFADGTTWDEATLEARLPLPRLMGTAAADVLAGTAAAEAIHGLGGDDDIRGFAGADRIEGGPGDDTLAGGAGSDAYVFGRGDGHDVIDQTDAAADDEDVIHVKAGIAPADVLLRRTAQGLWLAIDDTGDSIEVRGTGSGQPLRRIVFADAPQEAPLGGGTTWGPDVLDAAPLWLEGTAADDFLDGTEQADIIDGGDGNDALRGNAGDDILAGGAGDDMLLGGAGDDMYAFDRGDGHDTVLQDDYLGGSTAGDVDVVRFAADIAPADVRVVAGIDDIVLSIADSGDMLTLRNWRSPSAARISAVEFADGTVWDEANLLAWPVEINGTADDDFLDGTEQLDIIHGGDGNDALRGNGGNDILAGGSGDDTLSGGAGNDVYRFERGDGHDLLVQDDDLGSGSTAGDVDVVRFGAAVAPADVRVTPGIDDIVLGIADSGDTLTLRNWRSPAAARISAIEFADGTTWDEANLAARPVEINGSTHDDSLEGTEQADIIDGGDGNDALRGNGGDDTLAGGSGDDWLAGGAGSDVYLVAADGGSDTIDERGNGPASLAVDLDTIRFGPGIAAQDVALGHDEFGTLVLTLDQGASQISFNAYPGAALQAEFADGTRWGAEIFAAAGEHLAAAVDGSVFMTGGAGDDRLDAGAAEDAQVFGLAGNDMLIGGDGYSWLIGGAGDDTLAGGAGMNVYFMDDFSGRDSIVEAQDDADTNDLLEFGDGIAPDRLRFARYAGDGNDLLLSIDGSEASILIDDWFAPTTPARIENFRFLDDGTEWTPGDIDAAVWHANSPPLALAGSFATRMGEAFSVGLGESMLVDPDGDHMRYAVTLADGAPLPAWLHVDPASGVLSGSAPAGALGDYALSATASDLGGASASVVFDFAVLPAPDVTLGDTPGDDSLVGGNGNDTLSSSGGRDVLNGGAGDDSYLIDGTDGVVHIIDSGGSDTLVLQGLSVDDIELGVGSLKITVTATGREIHLDDFDADHPYAEGGIEYFRFADAPQEVPLGDGTRLTKAELIDALGFRPTGTSGDDLLSGTSLDDVMTGLAGNDTLAGRAGDDLLNGGSGDDAYVYAMGGGHDRIVDESGIDRIVFEGGISASGIVVTRDGGEVALNLSDTDSIRFAEHGPGRYAVERVEFAEGGAWQAGDVLRKLSRTPPTVAQPLADQVATEDIDFRFELPVGSFADADADAGDRLTYSATLADGAPLPAWLTFDAATGTFSGTPANADVGTLSLNLTATDLAGATASQIFALGVANTNDAPTVGAGITALQATEDSAFAFIVPADAFADVDAGDSLAYTARLASDNPLPAWLRFDPATRTFSGTPANADVGTLAVSLTATDTAGAAAVQVFDLAVINTNDAPLLTAPLPAVEANAGALFSWNLPAGSFVDPDADDVLGYSARLADGAPLPAWLGIDAASGTLAGTPGPSDAGALDIQLIATDASGASVAGAMTLTVVSLRTEGETFIGTRHADTLTGTAYNDVFDGRAGADTLIGLGGDDLYLVTDRKDRIVEQVGGGFDAVWADTDRFTLPDEVEALALIGGDDYAGTGNGLGNLLVGNRGDNRLDSLAGDDLLRGLAGADRLQGGAGLDALDGGGGDDLLEDGADAGFVAGGRGKDRLRLTGGSDVIAFNRGDNADRIEGGDGQNDTLSLGGGIGIDDIRLKKAGRDLIVDTGCGDTLRFDDWYRNGDSRSIATLQVAGAADTTHFERYDFAALVRQFDTLLAADRRKDAWTPGSEAARFKLGAATDEVAGGRLAAAYAGSGTLAEIRPEAVAAALATPRSDATATDALPDVPLPPPPAYHHGRDADHDGHGHHGHHGDHGQRDDERHRRDGRHGWLDGQGEAGHYLSPRDVAAAWQSWQQQGASPPSASPIDYARGWARVRDRLAGRCDESEHGGAWCDWTKGANPAGFSLFAAGRGAFGTANPVGLPGAALKPFEGLKEGFERLHGS